MVHSLCAQSPRLHGCTALFWPCIPNCMHWYSGDGHVLPLVVVCCHEKYLLLLKVKVVVLNYNCINNVL